LITVVEVLLFQHWVAIFQSSLSAVVVYLQVDVYVVMRCAVLFTWSRICSKPRPRFDWSATVCDKSFNSHVNQSWSECIHVLIELP